MSAIVQTFSVYRNTIGATVAPTAELQALVDVSVTKMRAVLTRISTVRMSTTFTINNQRYQVIFYPHADA